MESSERSGSGPRRRAVTLGAALTTAAIVGAACGSPAPYSASFAVPRSVAERIRAMESRGGPRPDGPLRGEESTDRAPATVAEISESSRVLDGPSARGAIGDFVMENGHVMVVIARPDGSASGGTIVDLGATDARIDALARMDTLVAGAPVVYSTLETGTDGVGGVFVEVLGHAGEVPVSTRYELRPGIDAVLIHTSFVHPDTMSASTFAAADSLLGEPGAEGRCDRDHGPGQCEVTDKERGYVLCALVDRGPLEHVEDSGAVVVGVDASALARGAQVYSRYLAPLERPDSLAVASALAVARGQDLGEIELTLLPTPWGKGRVVEPGFFWLSPVDRDAGAPMALKHRAQLHPGDSVVARAPVGSWYIEFRNDAYTAAPEANVPVEVIPGQRAKARVTTLRRPTANAR